MKDGKGIHVKYVPGTFIPLQNKGNDYLMDRAAQKARSSSDWHSVAAAYLRLGYMDNANAAQRRARDISR